MGHLGHHRHLGAVHRGGFGAVRKLVGYLVLVHPFAEALGVFETLRLGGRVDDDGVQLAAVLVGGARERRAGEQGDAGLHAYGVLVDVEEPVGGLKVDVGLRAVGARHLDGGAPAAHSRAKRVVGHGVLHHFRHVGRRAVQIACVGVEIKPVRVVVHRVGAAQLLSLGVHGVHEHGFRIGRARLHESTDRLGDGHGGIVARRHEQRLERRIEIHDVALLQARRRLAYRGGGGGNRDGRIERQEPVLHGIEGNHAGHDLRDGRDLRGALGVAFEVHGAVGPHDHGVLGVDAGALRHGQAACIDRLAVYDVCLAHVGEGGCRPSGARKRQRAGERAC